MELLWDIVNQNVPETLKIFQDTKSKACEKTQKQINELIRALNKHISETENIINTEKNELQAKIEILKRKWHMIWKTSEKNNETEAQKSMEAHSSRLE
jgi:hypothetical protein